MRLPARLPALLLAAFLLGLAGWVACAGRMRDPLSEDFPFLRPLVNAQETEFFAPDVWRIENVDEERFAAIVRAVPQKGFQGGFRPAAFPAEFPWRTAAGRTPPLKPDAPVHVLAGDPGSDGVRPVVVYDPATECLWLVRAAAVGG